MKACTQCTNCPSASFLQVADDGGIGCVPVAAAVADRGGRLTVTEFFTATRITFCSQSLTLDGKLARAAEVAALVDADYTKPGETLSVTAAEWNDLADSLVRLRQGDWAEQLDTFHSLASCDVMSTHGAETKLGVFVVDKGDGKDPFPLLLAVRLDRRTEYAQLSTLRTTEFLNTVARRVAGVNAPGELVGNARLKGVHVLDHAGLTVPYALFTDFLWGTKSPTPATDGGLLFSSWGDDLLRSDRDLPKMLSLFPTEVNKLRKAGLWNSQTLRFFGFVYGAVHDAQGHLLPLNMRDPRKDRVAFWLRGGFEETLADLHPAWCGTIPQLHRTMRRVMTAEELAAFPKVVLMKRVASYVFRGVETDPERGSVMLDHDQRCGMLWYGAMLAHGVLVSRGGAMEFDEARLGGFFDTLLNECLAVEAHVDAPEAYASALVAFNRRYGSFSPDGTWRVPTSLRHALDHSA
jgi:hypothetical protein